MLIFCNVFCYDTHFVKLAINFKFVSSSAFKHSLTNNYIQKGHSLIS